MVVFAGALFASVRPDLNLLLIIRSLGGLVIYGNNTAAVLRVLLEKMALKYLIFKIWTNFGVALFLCVKLETLFLLKIRLRSGRILPGIITVTIHMVIVK